MTIAENIMNEYNTLPCEENGFYGEGWYALIRKARNEAIEETEECPESCDSSIILKFEDGSSIYVANPNQTCYDGFIRLQ